MANAQSQHSSPQNTAHQKTNIKLNRCNSVFLLLFQVTDLADSESFATFFQFAVAHYAPNTMRSTHILI